MTTTMRPLAELVEEVAERLTSEQVFAVARRIAASELRPPEEPEKFDFCTSVALDLDATIRRAVALWVQGAGIEADIFAAWYLPQLVDAGIDELEALAALQRVVGWRPRSDEDRERAVAAGMLAGGFTPEQIAAALQERAPC